MSRGLVVNDVKLLRLVAEWALTRTHRLEALRAMHTVGYCEYEESDEPDAPGVPRCYRSGVADSEDWCKPCRKRDPIYQEMRRRLRVERDVFRRLCALVERSVITRADEDLKLAQAGKDE